MSSGTSSFKAAGSRAIWGVVGVLVGTFLLGVASWLILHEGRLTGAEKDIIYTRKDVVELKDDLKEVKRDVKDGFKEVQKTLTQIQRSIP